MAGEFGFGHRDPPLQQGQLLLPPVLLLEEGAGRGQGAGAVSGGVLDMGAVQGQDSLYLELRLQGHHPHPLGIPGSLGADAGGMEDHAPPLGGDDRRLQLLPEKEGGDQGGFVRVGPSELFRRVWV